MGYCAREHAYAHLWGVRAYERSQLEDLKFCCVAAEDRLACRLAVTRHHVLARPKLRSGVSVKADVETEP